MSPSKHICIGSAVHICYKSGEQWLNFRLLSVPILGMKIARVPDAASVDEEIFDATRQNISTSGISISHQEVIP